MKLGRPWFRQDSPAHTARRPSPPGEWGWVGEGGDPAQDPKRTRHRTDLPDSFVELDREADNLVITQSPLLLLQDLTTVLIGAVGDCKRRKQGLPRMGEGSPTKDPESQRSVG